MIPPSLPTPPDLPASLEQVRAGSLEDESFHSQMVLDGVQLSGQAARECVFEQARFRNVSWATTSLEEARFTDVVFENCDLAGAIWNGASLLRVTFVGCRLSALALNRGSLVDIQVSECRGDCPSVFESEGRRWLVEDSEFADLDCRGLRLHDGRFARCHLPRSQWGRAKLDQVAFVESFLAEAGGTSGLGGSSVDTTTLLSVAPALARQAGIAVVDQE